MDKLKQWVTLTGVLALGIVAVSWFLLVSPKRDEAAEVRAQAAQQVSANAMLRTQIEVLKAQAKELPREQASLAAVAAKIPDNPALPGLVRSLLEISGTADVELVSITPGAPVVEAAAVGGALGGPVQPANGQMSPVPPTAGAPSAPAAGQLASIPVSIDVAGSYFEVAQFVAALEGLPRALRVNDVTIVPGVSPATPAALAAEDSTAASDGSSLLTTVRGFVYMAAPTSSSATAPSAAATAPVAGDPSAVDN